jgi:hypothetical protein
MSLNDLRRGVANHDETLTKPYMGEPSVALDLRHWVSASGAPPLTFHFPKNHLLENVKTWCFSQRGIMKFQNKKFILKNILLGNFG